jgi:hypothetical protein
MEAPSTLRAHPEAIRLTLLAALCWCRLQEVTDELVTLLIALVHRMGARAERRVERQYIDDLKRVAGKTALLYKVAEVAVARPDDTVRDAIYPVVSEKTLRELVKEYKASGPRYRAHVYTTMQVSYRSHYRRMLPKLLEALTFRSNNETYRPMIQALALIRAYVSSGLQCYPMEEAIPLEGVIRPMWRDFVVEHDADGATRIHRLHYELGALQTLRDGLRSKEIWVEGARRFGNPEEDLPADFEAARETYYAALKQPVTADAFVEGVRTQLHAALERLATTMPHNKGVKLLTKQGGWIQVSPFAQLPEPPNLARLKIELATRWPMTGLLDILKETALRTHFTDAFTSIATREALAPDTLQKRLLLGLYALGTNTGLKRLAGADAETTYADLRYVRRR